MVANEVFSWVSKGLSNEKIISVSNSNGAVPRIVYDNGRIKVKLNGNFLKQNKITYNHGSIVNIYVAYRLTPKINLRGIGSTLQSLVQLNLRKADIDKYKCSGYIAFDSRGSFSHPSEGYGGNVIIFGIDLSSSTHSNNKTESILVLGKDFIQEIDSTTIYGEKMYSTDFTVGNKKFCLSLHYNGDNSYLFVNGKEIINFNAKDSEVVPHPLCLGGISKDFPSQIAKNFGLTRYIYDLSVDYWAITNDKILNNHKYLMKKNNIV